MKIFFIHAHTYCKCRIVTPIRFDDHFDTESLKIAVANLPYDDVGETRIDLGLELANEMFSVESGARGSSKKVCFALLIFYVIRGS